LSPGAGKERQFRQSGQNSRGFRREALWLAGLRRCLSDTGWARRPGVFVARPHNAAQSGHRGGITTGSSP
jgi:hypothetical protein